MVDPKIVRRRVAAELRDVILRHSSPDPGEAVVANGAILVALAQAMILVQRRTSAVAREAGIIAADCPEEQAPIPPALCGALLAATNQTPPPWDTWAGEEDPTDRLVRRGETPATTEEPKNG